MLGFYTETGHTWLAATCILGLCAVGPPSTSTGSSGSATVAEDNGPPVASATETEAARAIRLRALRLLDRGELGEAIEVVKSAAPVASDDDPATRELLACMERMTTGELDECYTNAR